MVVIVLRFLRGCLEYSSYDEFTARETILPRGGHAVLTGQEDKVVLAGEWHLLPDGDRAMAAPRPASIPLKTRSRQSHLKNGPPPRVTSSSKAKGKLNAAKQSVRRIFGSSDSESESDYEAPQTPAQPIQSHLCPSVAVVATCADSCIAAAAVIPVPVY